MIIATTNPITREYIKGLCNKESVEVMEREAVVCLVDPPEPLRRKLTRYIDVGNKHAGEKREEIQEGDLFSTSFDGRV